MHNAYAHMVRIKPAGALKSRQGPQQGLHVSRRVYRRVMRTNCDHVSNPNLSRYQILPKETSLESP